MIYFIIYCLLVIVTGFFCAVMSYRNEELTCQVLLAWAAGTFFAPFVWFSCAIEGFDNICDKCDVKRGLRVPKGHRIVQQKPCPWDDPYRRESLY